MPFENLSLSAFAEKVRSNLYAREVKDDVNHSILKDISIFFNNANGIDSDMETLNEAEYNRAIVNIDKKIAELTEQYQKAKMEKIQLITNKTRDQGPYYEDNQVVGGNLAKAFQTIVENAAITPGEPYYLDQMGDEIFVEISSGILGQEDIEDSNIYRDGGSRQWLLKDGTQIFWYRGGKRKEMGQVTITHPDGTKEVFNRLGEKIQ